MDWLRCPSKGSLVLVNSSVQVSINGWLADISYSLTYSNSGDEDLNDVQFTFPIDDSSAVYRLRATFNDVEVVSECRELKEAERAYHDAVAAGMRATLVSEVEETSDLFRCYLGNVDSGVEVRIDMGVLVELDAPEASQATLTLARVVRPRYRPEGTGAQPQAEADKTWMERLRLSGRVSGPPVRGVTCGNGVVQLDADTGAFVVEKLEKDGDIELTVEYATDVTISVSREAGEQDSFISQDVMLLTCFLSDTMVSMAVEELEEFVIVVDCSGSMHGDNISAASEALLLFLKSLPPNCKFNIVTFGSDFKKLFNSSTKYSEKSLKQAMKLQESLNANMGGTEILTPLKWVLEQQSDCTQRAILLLTDGQVSNVSHVKDLVKSHCQQGSGCRVSAIGIGHGASTSLVKGVARAGHGRAEFLRDRQVGRLRRAVVGLLKTHRMRHLEQLRVEVLDNESGESLLLSTVPECLESVHSSLRLSLFAILADKASGKLARVVVSGRVGSNDFCFECADSPAAANGSLLRRAAARMQIKEWTDDNLGGEKTADIVRLSVAAHLSSQYTAFVGVDRTSGREVVSQDMQEETNYMLQMCGLADSGGPICSSMSSYACSAPSSRGGQRSFSKARRLQRSSTFFKLKLPSLPSLPSLSSLWRRKQRPQASSSIGSQYHQASGAASPLEDSRNSDLLLIAGCQSFDGHWDVSDELADAIRVKKLDMTGAPDGIPDAAWVTALVYSHLTTRLSHLRAEWELLADKALAYVKANCADADSAIANAKKVLEESEKAREATTGAAAN